MRISGRNRAVATVLAIAALGAMGTIGMSSGAAKRAVVNVPLSRSLLLRDVTIIDPRDGSERRDAAILMDKGRIVRVLSHQDSKTVLASKVISAPGAFVVPGYNDMHVHVLSEPNPAAMLALMTANGITGFRQMGGSDALLTARSDRTLPLDAKAPALLQMPGEILNTFNARSPADAVAQIRRQKAEGADFIKLGLATPEVFYAAVDEALRQRIPILGHLQEGTDAARAATMGFRSIEHLGPGDTIWIKCSSQEAELAADALAHPAKVPPAIPGLQTLVAGKLRKFLINPAAAGDPADVKRLDLAMASFDAVKCRQLAATFITNRTWQVPTLIRLRTQERGDAPEYWLDPNQKYVPAELVKEWQEANEDFKKLPDSQRAILRKAYARQLQLTKFFSDLDVPMMTGTDDGGWLIPGFNLHQEFDQLAAAGLSPMKILQMTTWLPAVYLDRTTSMGTAEAGKNADLVILSSDPRASVDALHRIVGVVRAGFYYDRPALDALQKKVADEQGAGQNINN